jgi:hypothetical protein
MVVEAPFKLIPGALRHAGAPFVARIAADFEPARPELCKGKA